MDKYVALCTLALLTGCTSIEVVPIPAEENLKEISIKLNPKVTVGEFLPLVERSFRSHGIRTFTFKASEKAPTPYILTYTALRSWDLVTYLSHAEIRVEKDGRTVGEAIYHLNGKGGFSCLKWQGVETKMTPVLDELLKNYPRE